MYKKYKEKVEFFLIYIREAHPVDGWKVPQNDKEGINVKQPKTDDERKEVASDCVKNLKLSIPALLDDMKDTVNKAYAGWPDRIYVVDKAGKIVFKGDPGPRGFKPGEAEKALKKLLGDDKEKDK